METNKIRIGYYDWNYPTDRMIKGKCENFEYIVLERKFDIKYVIYNLLNIITFKKTSIQMLCNRKKYYIEPLFASNCEGIHCFNSIIKTEKEWIVSFENLLPNLDSFVDPKEYLIKVGWLIAKDNCKGILPMSQWAYNYTSETWKKYMPSSLYDACIKKMQVLLPPQAVVVSKEKIAQKYNDFTQYEFVFVGNDFWRKGGHDLIEVLAKHSKNNRFHISIISKLKTVHAEMWNSHDDEKEKMAELLTEKAWITWYNNIPNKQVLEILKTSHIGFLPTYEDTFGFCVLEMQACGVPVVTTNVNAVPEFNNDSIGWIIDLCENVDSRKVNFKEEEKNISYKIRMQLDSIVKEILSCDIGMIKEKAILARENIIHNHSVSEYGKKLYKLFFH